ncbi:MAG: hypothetical protein C4B58_13580 [Deltaproteobacteria bacterium]|nr:MAG: hypothetical protein C4B58_13580 [Deltaproteobacteria bacterium]
MIFGCSTVFHNVEWEKAILHLRDGRVDKAVSNLKPLLKDPGYSCKAAFYLFAFDGAKDEYIRIMRSKACKYEMPGEAKLLEEFLSTEEKLLSTEEKLLQLKSEYNKQQSSVNNLREETQNLDKELSRLRFELQKTEEIRRETEEWRIQ